MDDSEDPAAAPRRFIMREVHPPSRAMDGRWGRRIVTHEFEYLPDPEGAAMARDLLAAREPQTASTGKETA